MSQLCPQVNDRDVEGSAHLQAIGVQGSVRPQTNDGGVNGARAGSSSDVIRGVGEARENIPPPNSIIRGGPFRRWDAAAAAGAHGRPAGLAR